MSTRSIPGSIIISDGFQLELSDSRYSAMTDQVGPSAVTSKPTVGGYVPLPEVAPSILNLFSQL
jgi:hypothetical protein